MSGQLLTVGPEPGTPEWATIVTASKVSAILGVSPWESPRSLWHTMRGDIPWDASGNDTTRRGHYLEGGVLAWWRDQHPEWTGRVESQPWCSTVPWGGATPDQRCTGQDERVVLVEAKTAANDDEWGQPGTDEIPTHYLAQVYWQMAMDPAAERVYVPVLTSYLRLVEYVIERDDEVIADLLARCAAFHASLTADTPPPLDDHTATIAVLKALNPDIDRGVTVTIDTTAAAEWVRSGADLKAAEDRERAARVAVLDAMGRAQYAADPSGLRVARRQNSAHGVSLVRTAKTSDLTQENPA